ncbi:MAG: hypothetical protein IKP12_05415 [Acholeplasmatales bacterium]|nr:hypothetical protein [Acholeplasmatales bacterium]
MIKNVKKYFKRFFLFFVCLFSIGIFTNLKPEAADYTNADAGHFIIYADGSISAEFTVSENTLSMKGWLLCLFTSEPIYGTDNKLTASNNLHPYSVSECAHYFFVTSTQKEGLFNIIWNADSNDQKTNWSADGLVESEKKLSDYILDDTDWHIVIGPRHFNDSWAAEGIGAGDDGYWENCDIYIGQKSAITNFVTSTMDLIDGIGTVTYTNEIKIKINNARHAYDALSDDDKALVTNYEELIEAEATYQGYVDQDEASQVDALIAAIGEVEYTFESEDKIDDAREAYDLLTDTQKTLVTKYGTLTTAEATYQGYVDQDEASQVDALIAAIGEVTYDAESEEKIEDAREAYDLLTDTQKALVTKYSTLTTAEATYQGYVDQDEASQVDTLIAAIGEVTYDAESEEKIEDARLAYEALTNTQKALVTKYSTLTAAESLYSKLEEDHNKADEVIGLINAIGNVYFNDETKAKIDSARASYNLLTEDQKALVTNYDTLTLSEKVYQGYVDQDEASQVDALIDSIGDVEYTESCKNIIEASRKAYDALTDTQKTLVTKLETLTEAEATYAILKDNHEKAAAVIALINAIGKVTYSLEAKAKIDSAREAYDLLTATQKALVTNYATLIAAESFYSKLKDDHEKADATDALIDAIGDVSYSEACEEKLIAARESYNLLTEDQKALVRKLDDLEAKEEIYDNVSAVVESINSIGDVKYTGESKAKIDEANNLYNELTKEEKALVINNDKLTKAIKTYDDVKTVVEKINAIGEVKYAAGSKEEIDAARASYESLTKEEKALIPNYNKLEENESTYNRLEKDHKLFVGWMIALGVILGVIIVLVIVYLLLFFVFNKWMISNKKAIRVFRIGKKNEKIRVLKMNLIVKYTDENELYNSKNAALGNVK